MPCPLPAAEGRELAFRGLYDTCLALLGPDRVVGSDMKASGKPLVVVTGANQGGKSTFLRSLGLAQLMMQCGMFVSAAFFSADVAPGGSPTSGATRTRRCTAASSTRSCAA